MDQSFALDHGTDATGEECDLRLLQAPKPGRSKSWGRKSCATPRHMKKWLWFFAWPKPSLIIWAKILRTFQQTPGAYPRPPTKSLWKNSFHLGVFWGCFLVCDFQGYVGVPLEKLFNVPGPTPLSCFLGCEFCCVDTWPKMGGCFFIWRFCPTKVSWESDEYDGRFNDLMRVGF